jgi:hypothetical protein
MSTLQASKVYLAAYAELEDMPAVLTLYLAGAFSNYHIHGT